MRALADAIANELEVSHARLELVLAEAMIALRNGDLERYMRLVLDVADCMSGIEATIEKSEEADKTIAIIDPAFYASLARHHDPRAPPLARCEAVEPGANPGVHDTRPPLLSA